MIKDGIKAIFLVSLLVVSLVSGSGIAVATDGQIQDAAVINEFDRDGDGKYSAFDLLIASDTHVGGGFDASKPYYRIYINGQLVEVTDTISEIGDVTRSEYYFSQEELSDFESGNLQIRIELWDEDPFNNNKVDEFTFSPSNEFEPQSQDYSKKKQALIGISSVSPAYDTVDKQLDEEYLRQQQQGDVLNAFKQLLVLDRSDVRDQVAIALLDIVSAAAANAVDSAITAPAVVQDVGSSFEVGARANTIQKVDRSSQYNFHTNLDALNQNTNDISTDPNQVKDSTLEQRLKLIRKVYEYSVDYRHGIRDSYDNYHKEFELVRETPLLNKVVADEKSLRQVEGQLTQLQQLLITDYYYTQLALRPNQTPTNLTTEVSYRTPEYPQAEIVDYDIPEEATVGTPTTVSVTVKTKHSSTPSQTITTGFPDDNMVRNIHISDSDLKQASSEKVYPAGSELWTSYGEEEQEVPYDVAETAGSMSEGSTHTVDITFTPTTDGTIRLWFKSIAWTDTGTSGGLNPDPQTDGSNVVTDGQGEFAYEKTIEVNSNQPPVAEAGPVKTVSEGERVTISGSGSDPDGDSLSYSWTRSPELGSIDGNGQTVTYQAPTEISQEKQVTAELTVSDGPHSGSDTTTIEITDDTSNNDPDDDGIKNSEDKCPNTSEDNDGFQDNDGCPDPDNDDDGIRDVNDQAPNRAEDNDGCQDGDGVPDPDGACGSDGQPGGLPAVGNFDSPPTDPDSDGHYEDINGDGATNVADAQALFVNLDSSAVQNNPSAFDFNSDDKVNVADAQALFAQK